MWRKAWRKSRTPHLRCRRTAWRKTYMRNMKVPRKVWAWATVAPRTQKSWEPSDSLASVSKASREGTRAPPGHVDIQALHAPLAPGTWKAFREVPQVRVGTPALAVRRAWEPLMAWARVAIQAPPVRVGTLALPVHKASGASMASVHVAIQVLPVHKALDASKTSVLEDTQARSGKALWVPRARSETAT